MRALQAAMPKPSPAKRGSKNKATEGTVVLHDPATGPIDLLKDEDMESEYDWDLVKEQDA